MMFSNAIPTALSAFLGAGVEAVEALTIVLAMGSVRGWRSALGGAAIALAVLAAGVALFGPALTHIPLNKIHLILGLLLLLFGLRWLRKAMLRAAGALKLRDEAALYERELIQARQAGPIIGTWDKVALSASFQIVLIEGLEVVFLVLAMGAEKNHMRPAIIGALAAVLFVSALGVALRKPLALIPENTMKLAVGLLISAFGTLWIGEGLALEWPGGDLSFLALLAGYGLATAIGIHAPIRKGGIKPAGHPVYEAIPGLRQLIGFFADDARLAGWTLLWIAEVGFASTIRPGATVYLVLLFVGPAFLLVRNVRTMRGA